MVDHGGCCETADPNVLAQPQHVVLQWTAATQLATAAYADQASHASPAAATFIWDEWQV